MNRDEYAPFPVLADGSLVMVATTHGIALDEHRTTALRQAILALPAHPDVRPALEVLRGTPLRLAVLTSSTATSAARQMTYAGIDGYFDAALSAAVVRRYKPARDATCARRRG